MNFSNQQESDEPNYDLKENETILPNTQTMLEALNERLLIYKKIEELAKTEGNDGKVRRFGRIIKQYENAIKLHKAGKPINGEQLPTPPGFGSLPIEGSASSSLPISSSNITIGLVPNKNYSENDENVMSKSNVKRELTSRVSGATTNLAEKQMQILIGRQKEFKLAAIEAKQSGEIKQAKEYLLIFKKFEKLLDAAAIGLPVDLNSVRLFIIKNIIINSFNSASYSTFSTN